ncbi:MAG: protein-ADP-ribose hydrolase [Bacteroidales bacterium]|nr:protein-ADP-ribose hydrolase [Bacteroidales bacterium]
MNRIENIDFCIRYLLEHNGVDAEMPETLQEKQLLLRALMNVWEPQPLSDKFLQAQDAELQMQLQDKGIVEIENDNISTCQYINVSTSLWKGDITRLKVDAIVNAANSRGLGCWHPLHACIDNAIHSAAGLQLRQECDNTLRGGEIATGEAIITQGYNLPARYVIHTVGPIIATGIPTQEQERQLADCYRNCLRLAEENGCRSIAFCCISTGEFHFPNQRAAEIAVEACRDARIKVVFNVFKDIDYDIYRQLLGAH